MPDIKGYAVPWTKRRAARCGKKRALAYSCSFGKPETWCPAGSADAKVVLINCGGGASLARRTRSFYSC